MATESAITMVEWPSEKKKPDPDRTLAVLHQLPGDVVDRRDVVGVEGVTQPEAVGQRRGPEQQRIARGKRRTPTIQTAMLSASRSARRPTTRTFSPPGRIVEQRSAARLRHRIRRRSCALRRRRAAPLVARANRCRCRAGPGPSSPAARSSTSTPHFRSTSRASASAGSICAPHRIGQRAAPVLEVERLAADQRDVARVSAEQVGGRQHFLEAGLVQAHLLGAGEFRDLVALDQLQRPRRRGRSRSRRTRAGGRPPSRDARDRAPACRRRAAHVVRRAKRRSNASTARTPNPSSAHRMLPMPSTSTRGLARVHAARSWHRRRGSSGRR